MAPADSVIQRVISVCEAKDIGVWRIASARILRNIRAESYQLICPDGQIPAFMAATAPGWNIVGESRYAANCPLAMIRKSVSGENINRVHWLFQQFIKINAIVGSEFAERDLLLIWDADTVPLRPLQFIDPDNGAICYYHGKEHHRPYFETIEALCGFGRQTDRSFIAQCLPVRAGWVREWVTAMEGRFAASYVEAVLNHLPGKSGAEFSEYETIGSWLLKHHGDEVAFREKNRWLRHGSSLFASNPTGILAEAMFLLLAMRYDFVAIENWKRPLNPKRILEALRRRMRSGRLVS